MSHRAVRLDVEEFIAARADGLLRTAYLLTGDRDRAEDLLDAALARAWESWERSELAPEPAVRTALVRLHVTRWSGRRGTDRGLAARQPARPAWAGLARLTRRQRAVLVLCRYDGVPEADAADMLARPVGSLRRLLARAERRLAVADPGALLRDLAREVRGPATAARMSHVEHRVAVHRTRRRAEAGLALLLAAVAVVVVVAALPDLGRGESTVPTTPDLITVPTLLVGRPLPATLSFQGRAYVYHRSQESVPGQPFLRVAVAPDAKPQLLVWVSPPDLAGTIVVSVDGEVVARRPAGSFEHDVLLMPRRGHLVVVLASQPDVSARLGLAIYRLGSHAASVTDHAVRTRSAG